MKKEQNFFITVIKDYIAGSKTMPNKNIDWKIVFDYAQSHQLTAIIYYQCKSFISSDYIDAFRKSEFSTVYSNVNRKKITENTLTLLRENGIYCFTIKGFDIADYYPQWQFRTMGDVDIVVDDLEKAHAILLLDGFNNISKNKDREYQYLKRNMEFELHDRLVYDEPINLDESTRYLNDYKGYLKDNKLDDSFHFIFVLNHLRKHFMNSGIGFRAFVDVALLMKNNSKIDWVWTKKQLENIGLLSFSQIVFFYIEKWFSVTSPISAKEINQEVFEQSTEFIFNNGIFGYENNENKNYLVSNKARKSKHPKLVMIKYAISNIFPSYKTMIMSENYLFLKEKPFLLPIAWLYRFARVIKYGRISEGKEQIANSFVSKEYINSRDEMFENWGLQ